MRDRKPETLTLHVAKPDETPLLVYQGIPFVHRARSLTRINGRCRWDDIFYEDRERSYRIHRGTTNPPYLNIFLTNRLVYQESSMMFYAKNCFCFPSRDCELTLNACSGFLTDRPEQALTYLSNISLGIGFINWTHPGLRDLGDSRFYGIHWPTMQRLADILKGTPDSKGPNKLKFLLQEQCPSDRALAHHLESKNYCNIFLRMMQSLRENGLKTLDELHIILVAENPYCIKMEVEVHYMAYFVLGRWTVNDSKVSSSIVNVGNREMFRTRLTWSSSKTS